MEIAYRSPRTVLQYQHCQTSMSLEPPLQRGLMVGGKWKAMLDLWQARGWGSWAKWREVVPRLVLDMPGIVSALSSIMKWKLGHTIGEASPWGGTWPEPISRGVGAGMTSARDSFARSRRQVSLSCMFCSICPMNLDDGKNKSASWRKPLISAQLIISALIGWRYQLSHQWYSLSTSLRKFEYCDNSPSSLKWLAS